MDFEDLTIADLRRLFTALVALGGDDMVKKLIARVPAERELHGRVTIGTLFRLLEQTDGRTVLPEEIVALFVLLSHPEKDDQETLAAVARLVKGIDGTEEAPEPYYDDDLDTDWLNNTPEEIVEPPNEPDVLDEGPDSVFETLESELDTELENDDEAFFREMAEPEPLPELPLPDMLEKRLGEQADDLYFRLFGEPHPGTDDPLATTAQRFAKIAERLRMRSTLRGSLIHSTAIGAAVTVNRSQSLLSRIGNADCIADIDSGVDKYVRHRLVKMTDRLRGVTTERCQVVMLGCEASVSAVDRELKRLGYRHATIDELVAFAATRPVLEHLPSTESLVRVTAAGTKLYNSNILVPCLSACIHRGEFELTSRLIADTWHPGDYFLVVKKS